MDSWPPNGDNLLFSTFEQAVQRVGPRVFSRCERKTVMVMDRGPRTRRGRGENGDVQQDEIGRKRGAKLGEAVG